MQLVYRRLSRPVAIVGYTSTSGARGCDGVPGCTGGLERIVPDPEHTFIVDGKYFIYSGADRTPLEKLHFRIWDE